MVGYLAQRLATGFVTLFGVALIVFLVMRVVPDRLAVHPRPRLLLSLERAAVLAAYMDGSAGQPVAAHLALSCGRTAAACADRAHDAVDHARGARRRLHPH